jgi:4-hydroxybenzoate polyprenyltransferase
MTAIAKTRMMLEMIRFSHTIFALPFALMAALLAWSWPTATGAWIEFRWRDLLGILICMVTARSAAMAFNRLVDARIDAANPRTKNRHIPAGQLTVGGVALFTLANVVLFCAGTALFLPNRLPMILALPVLGVLFFYSFTKRMTALAHYWLGLALMLAPIAVWIALRGEAITSNALELLPPLTLGLAVMFWVGGFDIIYACQDIDFDRSAQLRSIPARMGVAGALRIAVTSHAAMVVMLVFLPVAASWAGLEQRLGWIYDAGVAAVAALLIYEHRLVRPDDLTRVNAAFFNVNAIVSFGLFVVTAIDTLVV